MSAEEIVARLAARALRDELFKQAGPGMWFLRCADPDVKGERYFNPTYMDEAVEAAVRKTLS